MRDKRFIAEHRGGPLKKEKHLQLIKWACECAENVLYLFGEKMDDRLINALNVAIQWRQGNASVGDARKASVVAHLVARESSNPILVAVARSIANDPEIIFADEPTGNLDSANSEEIHKLIINLKEKFNKTFVIVTHNSSLVNLADKVFEIKDGKIFSV